MQPRDVLALEKERGRFEKQKQHYFVYRRFKLYREHHALKTFFAQILALVHNFLICF